MMFPGEHSSFLPFVRGLPWETSEKFRGFLCVCPYFPYHVSFVLGSVLFIAFIQRSILSRTKVSQSLITDAYELVAESKKRKQVALRDGSCMFKIPGDSIDHKAILPEALSVVSQLNRAGFEAYIVGGGVRDLILGEEPKDFDVTTNATPNQICKVVKNCQRRIIGRRFKIVHCVFGHRESQIIIEVATFRNNEESAAGRSAGDAGMLTRDNSYGDSIEEDSKRRDYSINALYYSPKNRIIYDFHGGYYDILKGTIDMIGDPVVRIHEDPARIIRAYRFAAKLGFKISERTMKGFEGNFALIKNINSSRLFEEVNKFFLSGYGYRSFKVLKESNILKLFLTEQGVVFDSDYFNGFIGESLKRSDLRHRQGKPNMPAFLYAVLLWPLVNSMLNRLRTAPGFIHSSEKSLIDLIGAKVIASQLAITNFPNMVQDIIMEIWRLQADLDNGMDGADNLEHILANKFFRAGVDFMRLRAFMDDSLADACESWEEEYEFQSARALMFRKAKSRGKSGGRDDTDVEKAIEEMEILNSRRAKERARASEREESLKKELKKSGRKSRGSEKTKTKSRKKRSGKDKMKGGSRRGDESLNLTEWM